MICCSYIIEVLSIHSFSSASRQIVISVDGFAGRQKPQGAQHILAAAHCILGAALNSQHGLLMPRNILLPYPGWCL